MDWNRPAAWETVTAVANFAACGALLAMALLPAPWAESGPATVVLTATGAALLFSWVTLLAVHLHRMLGRHVSYRLHQVLIMFFVPFMGPALLSTRFRPRPDAST